MSAAMFFRIHQKEKAAQEHIARPAPALTLTEPFCAHFKGSANTVASSELHGVMTVFTGDDPFFFTQAAEDKCFYWLEYKTM